MKIFISYSRQDETLLAEFIKQLDAATNVGAALERMLLDTWGAPILDEAMAR